MIIIPDVGEKDIMIRASILTIFAICIQETLSIQTNLPITD
jgi:hypothetical protein